MIHFYLGCFLISFSLSYLPGSILPFIFGFNPIEIFAIVGLWLLFKSSCEYKAIFKRCLKRRTFLILSWFSFFMFLIGIVTTGKFINIYVDFRANIIFLFMVFIFKERSWNNKNRIKFGLVILFFISICDLFAMYLRPYFYHNEVSVLKQNVSVILPLFLMIFYFSKGENLKYIFLLGIVVYEVVFSFMRNVYFLVFLGVIIQGPLFIKNIFTGNKKLKIASIFMVSLVVLTFLYTAKPIYNYWNSDGSRSIHSINRTTELIDDYSTETVRINSFLLPFTEPSKLFFPKGLGSREHVALSYSLFNKKVRSTNDSAFFYLAYHYGIIFTYIFSFIFIYKIIEVLCRFAMQKRFYDFLIIFGLACMVLVAFFTQTIMLTFPPAAAAYGIIYGIILNPSGFVGGNQWGVSRAPS